MNLRSKHQNCSHITSGHVGYTGTRVISSNTCVNGESANWRLVIHLLML